MKAFLVVGPEGSGTYLLWEALASAGCGIDVEERPENYAVRYSLPHAGEWPDLSNIHKRLEEAGYSICALLCIREWNCTIQSVLRRDPDRDQKGVEDNIRFGVCRAVFDLPNITFVSYESFCLHPEFRRWLFCDKLGLPEPDIEIKYANEKYYD